MRKQDALARLRRMTNASGDPGLANEEIEDLLEWCARRDEYGYAPYRLLPVTDGVMTAGVATLSSASSAFTAADVGCMIQVNGAAKTGVPLEATVTAVVSGTQVTLSVPAGVSVSAAQTTLFRPEVYWTPTYSLQLAASEGWRWQAGKVVERYKFIAEGNTFVRDQVFTHCMKMATEYQKRSNNEPKSVRSVGNLVLDRLGSTTVPWWYSVAA